MQVPDHPQLHISQQSTIVSLDDLLKAPSLAVSQTSSMQASASAEFFEGTSQFLALFNQECTRMDSVHISAQTDKGFFKDKNNVWTCYRRNYFQLCLSFSLKSDSTQAPMLNEPLFVMSQGKLCRIINFRFRIYSKLADGATATANADKKVGLVQCTAKREKGDKLCPPQIIVTPSTSDTAATDNVASQNSRAVYKRLQFRSSTSPSTTKRSSSSSQQFFILVAELRSTTDTGDDLLVASCQSAALIVRSKSAAFYEKEYFNVKSIVTDNASLLALNSQNPTPSPSPAISFTGMTSGRFNLQHQESCLFSPQASISNQLQYQSSPAGFYSDFDAFSPLSPFVNFSCLTLRNHNSPNPAMMMMGSANAIAGNPGNNGFYNDNALSSAGVPVDLGFIAPVANFDDLLMNVPLISTTDHDALVSEPISNPQQALDAFFSI